MLQAAWKGYNGTQEEGFTGYQASDSVFCYIEIFDAQIPNEQGQKILNTIVSSLEERRPGSLASFEESVNASLKQDGLPLDFSLALGYQVESILYLKTIGSGNITLKRGNHYATVIHGNNVASGYLQEGDTVVFSTDYFLKDMKGEEHLRKILHSHNQLAEMDERMKVFYEGADEGGGLLLAVFQSAYAKPMTPQEEAVPIISRPRNTRRFQIPNVSTYTRAWGKKKMIGAAVIVVVFIALLLNIGHLTGTKQQVAQESKFDAIKTQIETESTAWSEDSGDMQHALGVIAQLRQDLSEIKKNDKKISATDIAAVQKELADYEAKVLKRQTVQAEEFYDLSVEEKGAEGSRMSLDGEMASILNRQGRIYLFSLENKSLKKKVFSEAANAGLVGSYEGSIYFFKQGAGIYKIDTNDAIKRIIPNDTEWGNVVDMQVYNGNIYLLDAGKENIFKYLVAQDGYSDSIPYFKSGIPSLKQGKSFAIDIAIYIGLNDSILKYLSGEQQDFISSFPESDISISKIFTSKEVEDMYGVDKAKGVVYVWDKQGTYVKQIQSNAFVNCADVVVYKGSAYVLKGPKILKVGL